MADESREERDARLGITGGPSAEPERRGGFLFVLVGILLVLIVGSLVLAAVNVGEGGAPVEPSPSPSPTTSPSQGITQEQLDELGASIQARYRSGDTEVAQALLDNFMDAHPECVSAVQSGGEGRRLIDIREQSEQAAEYLEQTAPYPQVYTTVITNRVDGVLKAAVLGVSCDA